MIKNLIKVIQFGSNRELFIPQEKILYFESLQYISGPTVSVITLQQPESPIHVINSLENLTKQFEGN